MLIGLAGYAGAGKDTVGKILTDWHGFKRIAFADKVKELALKINPTVWDNFEEVDVPLIWYVDKLGWDQAKQDEQVRELLQRIGQGARDILGEDVWLDAATRDYVYGDKVVFTDVRYPNELEYIHDMGGNVWWIHRPGVQPVNSHESENSIKIEDTDYFLNNSNSGALSLEEKVIHALGSSN